MAIVRGDHELSESKLGKLLGCTSLAMADERTIEQVSGGPLGFTGPVGLSGVKVVADNAVPHVANAVTGAHCASQETDNWPIPVESFSPPT